LKASFAAVSEVVAIKLLYEAAHSEEFDDHGGILIGGAGNSIQDQFGF
jgi:hypothetical protein